MNAKQAGTMARQLLLGEYQAVLSTISVDMQGYPFGSVVPYSLDRQGQPVILISDIAQHTKNIIADPRVSIICLEQAADDQQAAGRVTLLADAEKIPASDADAIWRYYSFFPHSRDYHKTHGFDFYRLKPRKIRFIGGFGRIHWLQPEDFLLGNPFSLEDEKRIIEHMNADHAAAIRHYCDMHGIALADDALPVMVGVDAEGIHLKSGMALHRITFPEPVADTGSVRKVLVEMAWAHA